MMSKIIIEVDGVRHVASKAFGAGNCENCSLKKTCRKWIGMPCGVFEVGCVFRRQLIPQGILEPLLALASEVKDMRRWQRREVPTKQDLKMKARAEVLVDELIERIENLWDEEIEGL